MYSGIIVQTSLPVVKNTPVTAALLNNLNVIRENTYYRITSIEPIMQHTKKHARCVRVLNMKIRIEIE